MAALLGIAVLLLGSAVTHGWFTGFDHVVSDALNLRNGQSPQWLIASMQGISWIGGGAQRYIMVLLLTLALWRWWGWGAGLAMGLGSLLSSVASDVMKIYFDRLRPDLVPHLDQVGSAAYPSGHATSAAVVYLLFILLASKARHPAWQAAAFALIILTGLSRIMLGVHWPSDVVGGWMLGTAFALTTYAVIARNQENKQSLVVRF